MSLLAELAHVHEGCGGSSSRLSRHTSWFAPPLSLHLGEVPSDSIQYPQRSHSNVVVPQAFSSFTSKACLGSLS